MRTHDDSSGSTTPADLLHCDSVRKGVKAGAAILFVDVDAHQPELAHFFYLKECENFDKRSSLEPLLPAFTFSAGYSPVLSICRAMGQSSLSANCLTVSRSIWWVSGRQMRLGKLLLREDVMLNCLVTLSAAPAERRKHPRIMVIKVEGTSSRSPPWT